MTDSKEGDLAALAHLWKNRKGFRDYFVKYGMTEEAATLDRLEAMVGSNVLDDLLAQYAHPNPTGAVGKVVDEVGMTNSQQDVWLKQCRVCCDDKTLNAFSKDRSKSDGLRNTCKQCDNMNRKDRYDNAKK